MKLKAWRDSGDDASAGFNHWCPACNGPHMIITEGDRSKKPVWTFDGNLDQPTVSPSVRVRSYHGDKVSGTCHYFIEAGRIRFCGDSTHALAGQTVDLPEWPYAE